MQIVRCRRRQPPEPWVPELDVDDLQWGHWARALTAMGERVAGMDLTMFVVVDADDLPRTGGDVVVLLIGDEEARVPPWSHEVAATFKTSGIRPDPLTAACRAGGVPSLGALLQSARCWMRHAPGAAARRRASRRGTRAVGPLFEVPIGCYQQVSLPIMPMAARRYDVSFAGSVQHWAKRWGAAGRAIGMPKVRSRERMLAAVRRLTDRDPHLRVHVSVTEGFANVAEDPRTAALAYAELLRQTRICLAPRGASIDTFRLHEGLRAGCVVVTDARPRAGWAASLPLIELADWNDAEWVIAGLLADATELDRRQLASTRAWLATCAPEAVGRGMAACLSRALGDEEITAATRLIA